MTTWASENAKRRREKKVQVTGPTIAEGTKTI
jgi:hypothetical protein